MQVSPLCNSETFIIHASIYILESNIGNDYTIVNHGTIEGSIHQEGAGGGAEGATFVNLGGKVGCVEQENEDGGAILSTNNIEKCPNQASLRRENTELRSMLDEVDQKVTVASNASVVAASDALVGNQDVSSSSNMGVGVTHE